MTWYVYALTEPDGAPRYVGTTANAKRRLESHLHPSSKWRSQAKDDWIASLRAMGSAPKLTVLETLAGQFTEGRGATAEARWIGRFLVEGASMLGVENVARARAVHDLPPDIPPFARALVKAIDRRELTYMEAADQIGVTVTGLRNWCAGRRDPRPPMRTRIALWAPELPSFWASPVVGTGTFYAIVGPRDEAPAILADPVLICGDGSSRQRPRAA